MEVLYLHGRGEDPRAVPGDRVISYPWPMVLRAPPLTADWLAQPFPQQVSIVDEWLSECSGAVGFSWGAWLLLCAALERMDRGVEPPPLLLLSCVLGEGNYTGSERWKAPRAKEVLDALGLGSRPSPREFSRDRVRFIQGDQDNTGSPETAEQLQAAGFVVQAVHGGHGLRGRQAAQVIERELAQLSRRAMQ